jgi:hypothetical protein
MHTLSRIGQRCFCGHLLRTSDEQTTGWCIECGLQIVYNEGIIDRLSTRAETSLISFLARKAVLAEKTASIRSSQPINEDLSPLSYARDLCEMLNAIAQALTYWADISARLLPPEEASQERKTIFAALYPWSIQQFRRTFAIQLMMQAQLQEFCEQQYLLLPSLIDHLNSEQEWCHARSLNHKKGRKSNHHVESPSFKTGELRRKSGTPLERRGFQKGTL